MRARFTLAFLAALAALTPPRSPAADPPADALAVLRANCHRCHGRDGSREGGFGNVLDMHALRERKLVVPGDAEQSKRSRRVAKGQMPRADESPRPSPADVETLKSWIPAGAAAPPVTDAAPVPDNARLFSLILTDL